MTTATIAFLRSSRPIWGAVLAAVAMLVFLLSVGHARAQDAEEAVVVASAGGDPGEGPDAAVSGGALPSEIGMFTRIVSAVIGWVNTPEGNVVSVFLGIVVMIDALRKTSPHFRRRKDGSIAWWASWTILGVCTLLGQVAAYGGLLSAFTAQGRIGASFAGLVVSAFAVAFNESIASAFRILARKALVKWFGKDAPETELTPGRRDPAVRAASGSGRW